MTLNIKNYFFSFIYLLVLYIYIYSPPFKILPFGPIKLLIIPALLYLLPTNKNIFILQKFKYELFFFSLIIIYSFIRDISSGSIVFFYQNLLILLEAFLIAFFLIALFNNNQINKGPDKFINILIILSFVASLITLFLILNPDINDAIKFEYMKYDKVLWKYQLNRGYGITDELLFTYGIVQGIILCFCITKMFSNVLYIIPVPFIFLSIFVNARIGLIPLFFLPFFIKIPLKIKLLSTKISTKELWRILFLFIIISLITVIGLNFLTEDIKESIIARFDWAITFFNETKDFLFGTKTTTYNNYKALFGEMVIFPQTLGTWIFGEGKLLFVDSERTTDIGYLLMLNYGGIVYMMLFFVILTYMFIRLIKSVKEKKYLFYILILTILAANYKGLFFISKPGFRLFILIYIYFILESYKYDNVLKKSI
jgi:hypothetical protein